MSSYNQQQNQLEDGAPSYAPHAPMGLPPGVGEFYKSHVYDPLDKLGYTGFRSNVKNWGEFGTHPGGPAGAMVDFNNVLANAQQTGDLSQIEPFMQRADRGNAKYQKRSGFFGTGFNPMPSSILGALGMFAAPFIPGALAGNFGTAAAAGATGAATTGIQGALNAAGMGIGSGVASTAGLSGVAQGFLPTTFGNASTSATAAAKAVSSQLPVALGGPSSLAQIASKTPPSLASSLPAGGFFNPPTFAGSSSGLGGSLPTQTFAGLNSSGVPGQISATGAITGAGGNILGGGASLGGSLPVQPFAGLAAAGATGAATSSAATASLVDKVKDFLASKTGKISSDILKNIVGSVLTTKSLSDTEEGLNSLESERDTARITSQTQNAMDSLEASIRGVDRDAYIKEQIRQFTAESSAAAGVDSGAYITGLQQVISNSILDLAKFQADASYQLGALSQNAGLNSFQQGERLLKNQVTLDSYSDFNSSLIAGQALDFLFD